MIDCNTEHVVTLAEAVQQLPRRRGRPIHLSTLYRWTVSGCRGVILESIQVGATRATSREALQRFFERLTSTNTPSVCSLPSRSLCQRQRRSETAARELERLGV